MANPLSILARILTILATLIFLGLLLKLIGAVLQPVLPSGFLKGLTDGFDLLYAMASPAIAPAVAILLLGAVVWTLIGRSRK